MKYRYGYLDDVKYALGQLGGAAYLEDIVGHVLTHRSKRRATTGHLEEYVWYTLQKNSAGRGGTVFDSIPADEEGEFIWRLIRN